MASPNFEFIAYGAGDIYRDIFSSVAMTAGSSMMASLINLTMLVGLIMMIFQTVTNANVGQVLKWFIMSFLIYGILFVPKVTVHITDKFNPAGVIAPVANVPLGVGVSAALISQVGDAVISTTENAFGDPNDTQYSKYGVVFGAKVMEKIAAIRPENVNFRTNLKSYMTNCAQYDIVDGTVTGEKLAASDDPWALLKASANPGRMAPFVDITAGTEGMETCPALAARIDPYWVTENTNMITMLGMVANPSLDPNSAEGNTESAMNAYLAVRGGSAMQAKKLVQMAMVRNSLTDSMATTSNGPLAGLASTVADEQTRNTQGLLGSVGEKAIPVMKILIECLFIGIFPTLFPLFLMPKVGLNSVKMYLVGFVYLQLWGPMYVILHKIMMFYAYQHASAATIELGRSTTYNMANIAAFAQANADVTALAGSMMLMIPVLAGLVTRGAVAAGAQGEALLGQFRSGADAGGAIMTTGNMSLGNTSYDNHNFGNTTGSQVKTSASSDTENSYRVMAGGGLETRARDGSETTYQGAAGSFGAGGIHGSSMQSQALSKEISDTKDYGEHVTAAYSEGRSLVGQSLHQVQDNVSHGKRWDDGLTDSQRSSIGNTADTVLGRHNGNTQTDTISQNVAWNAAFNAGLGAGFGGGGGGGAPTGQGNGVAGAAASSGGLPINAKAGYDSSVRSEKGAQSQIAIGSQDSMDRKLSESYHKDVSNASDSSFHKYNGNDHSETRGNSKIFSNEESYRNEMSRIQNRSEQLSQRMSDVQTNSATYDSQWNNSVRDWAEQKGFAFGDNGASMSKDQFYGKMDHDNSFNERVNNAYLDSHKDQILGTGNRFDDVKALNIENSDLRDFNPNAGFIQRGTGVIGGAEGNGTAQLPGGTNGDVARINDRGTLDGNSPTLDHAARPQAHHAKAGNDNSHDVSSIGLGTRSNYSRRDDLDRPHNSEAPVGDVSDRVNAAFEQNQPLNDDIKQKIDYGKTEAKGAIRDQSQQGVFGAIFGSILPKSGKK